MPFFTSDRERRLWVWAIIIMIAIYATLGVTPAIARALRDRGLINAAFNVGALLIGAAVLIQSLRKRPSRAEIGVALGVIGAYLIAFLRTRVPEERTHLVEYSVLALIILEALTERANQGRRVPALPLLAILATGLLGTLDELIQSLLPNRVFDPIDILFNFLAGVMTVLASLALRWARRRAGRRRKS